jgi:hypothetical protein
MFGSFQLHNHFKGLFFKIMQIESDFFHYYLNDKKKQFRGISKIFRPRIFL